MRFERGGDPDAFAERVWSFVAERLERNIIGTLLTDVRAGRYDEYSLALGVNERDRVVYVGMRIPPWYLVTSDLDPALAPELIDWWMRFDSGVQGVDGPPAAARAIADAWAARSGGTTRLRLTESMHALDQVTDPPHGIARGALRLATETERELLIDWMAAFQEEAGMPGMDREHVARGVDVQLAQGKARLWEDGRPVSLVGVNCPVAGVVRIGPVYTPPELRGRGYAASAVATASRKALAGGADRCMLFTDVANPTSNKIYAEVGYRWVGAWEQHAFERGGEAPAVRAGADRDSRVLEGPRR